MKAPATLENKVASKTVLSGEEATLQAAYTLDDLFERVPNVIDNGSTFGLFIIRGVENTNGTFTVGSTSQSAPVIVDGVPLSTFAAGYFRPIT
ncbi:MAG: Plug domain-containing protein [Lentisphaerales bacterium]|nr:Plug domain-containing protein [Lentisphaerales bacterium]